MKRAGISPSLVANELLIQRAERGGSLTPLQLIKMVYLCQGWTLGVENTALFEEDIEAWQYGPVIPSVYYAYKQFAKSPITPNSVKAYPLNEDSDKAIDDKTNVILKNAVKFVLDVYGDFTGNQLSNLTHQAGTPWSEAYDGTRNKPIKKSIIKKHFEILAKRYHTNG